VPTVEICVFLLVNEYEYPMFHFIFILDLLLIQILETLFPFHFMLHDQAKLQALFPPVYTIVIKNYVLAML